jgi:hypothetical protein
LQGKSVVAAVKRAKRPGKLETRRAIEGAGDALVKKKAASGTIEVKKKGVQNSYDPLASDPARVLRLTFPNPAHSQQCPQRLGVPRSCAFTFMMLSLRTLLIVSVTTSDVEAGR